MPSSWVYNIFGWLGGQLLFRAIGGGLQGVLLCDHRIHDESSGRRAARLVLLAYGSAPEWPKEDWEPMTARREPLAMKERRAQ